MIEYSIRDDSIVFNVKVVPRASRTEIVGHQNGMLRVRVAAPPVEGAANTELIRLLAKHFKVKPSAVNIISGHTGRNKKVSVKGGDAEKLEVPVR